jgi:hypothetical protein
MINVMVNIGIGIISMIVCACVLIFSFESVDKICEWIGNEES